MKFVPNKGFSQSLAVTILLLGAACEKQVAYGVAEVSSNDRLHGKSIRIQGCLSVHRHGKAIVDCSNDDLGMALDTSHLKGSSQELQEFRVLVARAAGPNSAVKVRVIFSGVYAGYGIERPDNVFVADEILDAAEVGQ